MGKLRNLINLNSDYCEGTSYGLKSRHFYYSNQNNWDMGDYNFGYTKDYKLLTNTQFVNNVINKYLTYNVKWGLCPISTVYGNALVNASIASLSNYRILNNFSDLSSGSSAKQYRLLGFMLRNYSTFSRAFTSLSTWTSYLNSYGWTYRYNASYGSLGFYDADTSDRNTMLIMPTLTNNYFGGSDTIPKYGYKFDHDFFGDCIFNVSSTYDVNSYFDSIQFFTGASSQLILADVSSTEQSNETIRVTPIFLCIDWTNLGGTFAGSNNWHSNSSGTPLYNTDFDFYESSDAVDFICPNMRPDTSNNKWTSQSYYSKFNMDNGLYGIEPAIYLTDKFKKAGTNNSSGVIGIKPTKYQTTFTYQSYNGIYGPSFTDSSEYVSYNEQYLKYGDLLYNIISSINSTTGFISNRMNKDKIIHEIDWYNISTLTTSVTNTGNSTYLSAYKKFLNYYCRGTYNSAIFGFENPKGYIPIIKRTWIWLFSYVSANQIYNYICKKRSVLSQINQELTDNGGASYSFSSYNNANNYWYNYFDRSGSTGVYLRNVYPWGLKTNFLYNGKTDSFIKSAETSISGVPSGRYYINRHVYLVNDIEESPEYGTYKYLTSTSANRVQSYTIDF